MFFGTAIGRMTDIDNDRSHQEYKTYSFFRKLIDAHAFDACPALGSAMHCMFFSEHGYDLWQRSRTHDLYGYQSCERNARLALLRKVRPETADYVLASFSFALGVTYSEQSYNALNASLAQVIRSWNMSNSVTKAYESKAWDRYLFMSKIGGFIYFLLLRLLPDGLFVLLFMYASCRLL